MASWQSSFSSLLVLNGESKSFLGLSPDSRFFPLPPFLLFWLAGWLAGWFSCWASAVAKGHREKSLHREQKTLYKNKKAFFLYSSWWRLKPIFAVHRKRDKRVVVMHRYTEADGRAFYLLSRSQRRFVVLTFGKSQCRGVVHPNVIHKCMCLLQYTIIQEPNQKHQTFNAVLKTIGSQTRQLQNFCSFGRGWLWECCLVISSRVGATGKSPREQKPTRKVNASWSRDW